MQSLRNVWLRCRCPCEVNNSGQYFISQCTVTSCDSGIYIILPVQQYCYLAINSYVHIHGHMIADAWRCYCYRETHLIQKYFQRSCIYNVRLIFKTDFNWLFRNLWRKSFYYVWRVEGKGHSMNVLLNP